LPGSKERLKELASGLTPISRPGDYAQAVMDLGATICTPRSPACGICPWIDACAARRDGIAAELPRKSPKKPKPTRFGIVYVAQRTDGAWLLETRPDRGLLGGMLGWPGSDWTEERPGEAPPLHAEWANPGLEVLHTFTHFHLRLDLRLARVGPGVQPDRGAFLPREAFRPSDLPTVMRKVHDLATEGTRLIE
jgi:A/G-specific adenine glycosylase